MRPRPITFFTDGSGANWTEMPRGGHFAAHEEPELLADDIRAFFRPLRAD